MPRRVACGRGDPAAVVKSLLKPKPKAGKQPALTDLAECRQLIADVEAERASPITKLANRLIALTAVRSAVQRHCRWTELEGLDGPAPIWRVPPSTMKLALKLKDDITFEHIVPLSGRPSKRSRPSDRLPGTCRSCSRMIATRTGRCQKTRCAH